MNSLPLKKPKRLKRKVKPVKEKKLKLDFNPRLGSGVQTITDPEVAEAHRRLGGRSEDLTLAKRVVTNRRRNFPQATLPELVTYDWLKANNHQFQFQRQALGGRSALGGLVPDFLVERGGNGMVWLVNGEYWHSSMGQRERDQYAINALRGMVVNGIEIEDVVQLWEDDIYNKRPQVFEWAMQGIGLRG